MCSKILLNDLDVSSAHMERLIRDFAGSQTVSQNFLDLEVATVRENLSSFTTLVPKFRSTLRVRFQPWVFAELLILQN